MSPAGTIIVFPVRLTGEGGAADGASTPSSGGGRVFASRPWGPGYVNVVGRVEGATRNVGGVLVPETGTSPPHPTIQTERTQPRCYPPWMPDDQVGADSRNNDVAAPQPITPPGPTTAGGATEPTPTAVPPEAVSPTPDPVSASPSSGSEVVSPDSGSAVPSTSRYSLEGFVAPSEGPTFAERRRRNTEKLAVERSRRRSRRRRRRIVGWVSMVIGLVLLTAAWVAFRAYQAYSNLQVAAELVTQLQTELSSTQGPDANAVLTLENLQEATDSATSATGDPFYRLAKNLPGVGPNLDAVAEIAETVDGLALDVLPPLVRGATALDPAELLKGGTVDLQPIIEVAPALRAADEAVSAAIVRMAAIDRGPLVGQVNSAVIQLWSKLDSAKTLTDAGARTATLLPDMMGAEGPRTYLLVFQNLAEVRATGGLFGSVALLKVDDGRISIGAAERVSSEVGVFQDGIGGVDPELLATYGNAMAMYPGSANFSPNFATGAQIFERMYRARTGVQVDGVVAVDPVALSYLMDGGPPVDVGDGVSLTSSNVVRFLLSDVYAKFADEPTQAPRDAFTAQASALVAAKMLDGGVPADAVVAGMRKAMAERRLLIWSAHQEEQSVLAQTSLAGELPQDSEGAPTIGVYLNDGSGAKLGYYLDAAVDVSREACGAAGSDHLLLSVTLRNTAPPTGLPRYVAGGGFETEPYVLRTNVVVMAPSGGAVLAALRDDVPVGVGSGRDSGRVIATLAVDLKPGEYTVIALTLTDGPGATAKAPVVHHTPTVSPWVVSVDNGWIC